jgi:SAM-dependent methyltransferase
MQDLPPKALLYTARSREGEMEIPDSIGNRRQTNMSLKILMAGLLLLAIATRHWTAIQLWLLRRMFPREPDFSDGEAFYTGKSKLSAQMGLDFFQKIQGKTVIDFGCGEGKEAIEMAGYASRVIGVDMREEVLEVARQAANQAGVADRCLFVKSTTEPADIVVSLDAFEHFGNPGEILRIMASLLRPDGEVLVSFGPIWYHPLGGHGFSLFPWSHIIFSEKALMAWRADFRNDGVTRFSEVDGGLNQMTISRFKKLVAKSPLKLAAFNPIPIRRLRPLHNLLTREFTTAVVQCRLVRTQPK